MFYKPGDTVSLAYSMLQLPSPALYQGHQVHVHKPLPESPCSRLTGTG